MPFIPMLGRRRVLTVMALTGGVLIRSGASDANAIVPPSEIVIHIMGDIADLAFLPLLEAALTRTLRPPVRMVPARFDPTPLRSRRTPTNAEALLDAFTRTLDGAVAPNAMHILLLTDDIQLPPARFNFAVSRGGPETGLRVMAVSLARLMRKSWGSADDPSPPVTAERVSRMIVKNTARMSGLFGSVQCVMSFPDSLAALDAMPLSYCEPDLSVLIEAGVARPIGR